MDSMKRQHAHSLLTASHHTPAEMHNGSTGGQGQSLLRAPLGRAMVAMLALLGVLASVLAWAMDEAVIGVHRLHAAFTRVGSDTSWFAGYIMWLLFRAAAAAAAVFLTRALSPIAAGSGIPEMRAYMAGLSLPGGASATARFLSLRTLVAKVVGLVLAIGAGVSIGKEGPLYTRAASVLLAAPLGAPGLDAPPRALLPRLQQRWSRSRPPPARQPRASGSHRGRRGNTGGGDSSAGADAGSGIGDNDVGGARSRHSRLALPPRAAGERLVCGVCRHAPRHWGVWAACSSV